MDNPLISVIIPIYKTEEYMRETIDSVLNQTYTNLEVILIDDGTPDRGGEICDEYAQKDNRVIVIHKENGGLSSARNAGLDICTGDLISFIDSDDIMCEDVLEHLLKLVNKHNADIATCTLAYFQDGDKYSFHETEQGSELLLSDEEAIIKLLYCDQIVSNVSGKIIKRNLFDCVRFPDGVYYEDFYTMCHAMANATRIVHVNSPKIAYRVRHSSQSREGFSLKELSGIKLSEELCKFTQERYPNAGKAALCNLLNMCFHLFFMIPIDQYCEQMETIWMRIKMLRMSVLIDSKARRKTRAAALLSFSGKWITHRLGKLILNELNRRRGIYFPS